MFARTRDNTKRKNGQRRGLGCACAGNDARRGLAGVVDGDDPKRIAWTRRIENATTMARVMVPVSESDGEITRQVMREQVVSVPAVRVVANENPAFSDVFPLASALESLGAPPRFIGNRNSPKFYYVDAWPIGQATAFGRWSLAVQAFERKRLEFATAKTSPTGAASYAGNYTTGPVPPDINQLQYSNDQAALQAFLDGVFVYVQGPLIDPAPEVLARYDRAAGYPVPVTFTDPAIRAQVVAAGLRPASIPLVAQAQALGAQAVQAAIVPAGTQQAAQAALQLIQANAATTTTTSNTAPQSTASAPTPQAPSVATGGGGRAAGASVTAPAASSFFNAGALAPSRTTAQAPAAAGFVERSGGGAQQQQQGEPNGKSSGLLLGAIGLLAALLAFGS